MAWECASLGEASLGALERVVANLLAAPLEPKFRVLRLENPSVREKIASNGAAVAFLHELGFVDTKDGFLALNGKLDAAAASAALEAVRGARAAARPPPSPPRSPEGVSWAVSDAAVPVPRRRRPRATAWGPAPATAEAAASPEAGGGDPRGPAAPPAPADAELRRVTRPTTRWGDVVGLDEAACELRALAADGPCGLRDDRLILLYGPPGCGKTTLAECLAADWGTGHLVTAHGAELTSPYSRSAFDGGRRFYARAKALAPSVLLVKDLPTVLASDLRRLVDVDDDVVVVATNAAPLAPARSRGRRSRLPAADGLAAFDALLAVSAPDAGDRALALARALRARDPASPTASPPRVAEAVDVYDLAAQTEGFSARALFAVSRYAARTARRRGEPVAPGDFDAVLDAVPMRSAVASAADARHAPDRDAAAGLVCDFEGGSLRWLATTPVAERALAAYVAREAAGDETDDTAA